MPARLRIFAFTLGICFLTVGIIQVSKKNDARPQLIQESQTEVQAPLPETEQTPDQTNPEQQHLTVGHSQDRAPTDPRDWGNASILTERIEAPSEPNQNLALRHRIVTEDGFKFPIRITDAIEYDENGEERNVTEISAYAANQVLLHSSEPLNESEIAILSNALGWTYLESESSPYVAVLQSNEAELDTVEDALLAISLSGSPLAAEPNQIFYASLAPNDPRYQSNEQWSLNAESDIDIDAPEAWETRSAAHGITIAIIDTGIRLDHEDLAENIWTNAGETSGNAVDEDKNGFIDDRHGFNAINPEEQPIDDNGHGTHVAGIAGAVGNNGKGVSGVSWGLELMAIKVLNSDGRGNTSNIVKGIDYAVQNGAHIINASWGSESNSAAIDQAIERAQNKSILFVTAAGNEGNGYASYPGRSLLSNVITVGSVDRFGSASYFSNQSNTDVDIMAPGEEILSTWHEAKDAYSQQDGTSMAAPIVSGALALTLAQYPNDSWRIQKQRLLASSIKNEFLQFACASSGIVNLNNALAMEHVPNPPNIIDTSSKSIEVYEEQAVELWAKAESQLPLTYKWFHEGSLLDNQSDTLAFASIAANQTGTYRLEISNADATLSLVFSITVRPRFREIEALIGNGVIVYGSRLDHWELVEEDSLTYITNTQHPRNTESFLSIRSPKPGLLRLTARRNADLRGQYGTLITGTGIYQSIYREEWETFDFISESESNPIANIKHSNLDSSGPSEAGVLQIQIPNFYAADKLPPIFRERISSGTYAIGRIAFLQVLTEQKNVTYQWYKKGQPIEGETTHQLSITIASIDVEGDYHVVATNEYGSRRSKTASIKVDTSPQPARIVYEGDDPLTLIAGQPFQIPFAVYGAEPIEYQWYRNHEPIPGATSRDLNIGIATPAHNGEYHLVVKNEIGGWYPQTSQWLRVQVSEQIFPPDFAKDDEDKQYIAAEGQAISIGPTNTSGSLPINYIWHKNGSAQPQYPSSMSLAIDAAKPEDAGTYYVEARNSVGTKQSARYTLQVTPPIDEAHDEPKLQLVTSLPKGAGYNYLVNQTSETYDGVDALEFSVVEWGNQAITFERIGQEVQLKYRWKSSVPDGFELRYRNEQYNWVDLTGNGTWKEEITRLDANHALEFEFSPKDSGAVIWFDSFEIIRAPYILQQISYDIPVPGNSVTLRANLLGDDIAYQWHKDGVAIAGATNATLTLNSFSNADAGKYHLVASNDHGSATTAAADVQMGILDSIVKPPLNLTFTGQTKTRILTPTGPDEQERILVASDSQELWGFESTINGPTVLDISFTIDPSYCTLSVDGSSMQVPAYSDRYQTYSHFIPSGSHSVKFSLEPWVIPSASIFHEIKTRSGPTASLKPSEDIHYSEPHVPIAEYAGAAPLTLKWYKDGKLFSTRSNLVSGSSYPYSRGSVSSDHGEYYFEITDKDGITATSEKVFFDQWRRLKQVIDFSGDQVDLYDQGFTHAYFDQTQSAMGSSSLALEGPFNTKGSTSVTIGVKATHAVFKVRSSDFPEGTIIKYLYENELQELAINADWQEITVQTKDNRFSLEMPTGDERSTLWIDQLSAQNKYSFHGQPNNITTYLGARVEFEASAYAESSFNNLELTWFKDGKELESEHWNRFWIESVQEEDLGQYVAQATTPDGETIHSRAATLSLTDKALSLAIGYPAARITTIGPRPWVVDYEDSVDGPSSVVSSLLPVDSYSNVTIEIDGYPSWGIYYYVQSDKTLGFGEENKWLFQNAIYDQNLDAQKVSLGIREYGDESGRMNRRLRFDGVRVTRFGDAVYEDWISEKTAGKILPSGTMGRTSDLDKDGIPNWLEFTLNLDPTVRESLPSSGMIQVENQSGGINLHFFAARSNDYYISYEISHDLATWSPATPALEIISSTNKYDEIQATLEPISETTNPFFVRWTIHSIVETGQGTFQTKGH